MTEQALLYIVQQALPIAQEPIWLDQIFHDLYLVTFERAPGLFVLAHKPSSPRELAVQLAIRQIEADAYASFRAGFEQAQALRNFQPQRGAMQ